MGSQNSSIWMFILAFLAVLALIGAAAWLVRHFAGNRLGANASRGRMPRLAVIDAAAVDGRRRLVLVRRDNVEHLLMIGGPTDIVVEPNIVRASPAREQQTPQRGGLGAESRQPLPEPAQWDAEPANEPQEPQLAELPPLPPRQPRPSLGDDQRRGQPAMPMAERRPSESFASLVPDQLTRPEPPMGRPEPPMSRPEPPMMRSEPSITRADPPIVRAEPPRIEPRPEPRIESAPRPRAEPAMPRPPRPEPKPAPMLRAERPAPPPPPPVAPPAPQAPPAASAVSTADQNLADMANRLEAALRRPPGPTRTEAAPPVAPEPPSGPAPRPSEPRTEDAAAPAAAPTAGKSGFESLEDEMAALLGRPKSPS
jgi:flagellar biogenesis protein FliO